VKLTIPDPCLLLLIGISGSGKSTFARKHFLLSEIVSSDHCRYLVSDDENNQEVTADAFEILRLITRKRLAVGKLTVIDATNVQVAARKTLLDLARESQTTPVAIVFDLTEEFCFERNRFRLERSLGIEIIRKQADDLKASIVGLKDEDFLHVYVLNTEAQIEEVRIERQRVAGSLNVAGDR
jgi:protein phosphatase